MNDKADVEALASLLEGSGLMEGMSGGKRSHKGQYVRWLIGQIVKRNPSARVKIDGKVHYNPPYNPPFHPTRIEPVAVSERFGEVPRSEFINRMLAVKEDRGPMMKAVVSEARKRMVKRRQPAPAPAPPAKEKINTETDLRRVIIKHSKEKMTTRGILKKIQDDYEKKAGIPLSQPTITRIVKKWREGVYNDDGTFNR
jgi:hypothetical protein